MGVGSFVVSISLLLASGASLRGDGRVERVSLGKVGAVTLANSCTANAQDDLGQGIALLHSFFYEEARIILTELSEREPTCALAFWGVAMTYFHPLWSPPLTADVQAAIVAADRASALPASGPIEVGLIASMKAYWHYKPPGAVGTRALPREGIPSCHGGAPALNGAAEAFQASLTSLHNRFPDDVEVTSFYALSLLGAAAKEDRTLTQQRKAAVVLEAMWKKHPNHPGLVHYLIHAYDYPETARLGLPAARAYGAIAPQVPHALHMPSHIYTRLGMWEDEEASNLASLVAAQRWMSHRHPGATFSDALHDMDYLEYGYLQQGRYAEADAQSHQMAAVQEVYPPNEMAAAFARAIVPARSVLERERWEEAAHLQVAPIAAWEAYPFVRSFVAYARAIGAARLGDVKRAQAAVTELERLERTIPTGPLGYFSKLVASYRLAARGWISHLEKRDGDALAQLTEAADSEDALGPHPVSPGPLLPARELLGDLLLALGRARDARAAYEKTLEHSPGRLRSLAGAMRAAKQSGDAKGAAVYAREVLDLTAHGATQVTEEARKLLQ